MYFPVLEYWPEDIRSTNFEYKPHMTIHFLFMRALVLENTEGSRTFKTSEFSHTFSKHTTLFTISHKGHNAQMFFLMCGRGLPVKQFYDIVARGQRTYVAVYFARLCF